MIRKGDRVKFINDTTVGTVASVEGKMARVTVEEGFEIPVLITDLVAIDTDQEQQAMRQMGVGDGTPINTNAGKNRSPQREKKPQPPRQSLQYGKIALVDDDPAEEDDEDALDLAIIRQNYLKRQAAANDAAIERKEEEIRSAPSPVELTEYDIKLCFVPQDATKPEESAQLACYMVNDSSYRLFYTLARWNGDKFVSLLKSGLLEEDSKEQVKVYRREELNRPIKLQISLLLFKPTNYVPAPAEDFTLELSPMKFVRRGSFTENDFFDEPAVIYTLATDKEEVLRREEAQKALEENLKSEAKNVHKEAPKKQENDRRKTSGEPEVIDLHAEEILDETAGMSPAEIIQAQLARFEIALDLAVHAGRRQRMVFIHGVGSGKLKHEMKKLLAAKFPRLRYQDASFKEYGYGAMMVFI
jgi:hypothetical protein